MREQGDAVACLAGVTWRNVNRAACPVDPRVVWYEVDGCLLALHPECADDKRNGRGVFTIAETNDRYEGEWRNGKVSLGVRSIVRRAQVG